MPHDEACENATEPECHCACGGRLHGTKAGRPSAPRMGDAQIFDSSTLSQDEWARQAADEEGPWTKWGLTKEAWNTRNDDGDTLGEAIKAASDEWGEQNVTISDWDENGLPQVGTPDEEDKYSNQGARGQKYTKAELKQGVAGDVAEIWWEPPSHLTKDQKSRLKAAKAKSDKEYDRTHMIEHDGYTFTMTDAYHASTSKYPYGKGPAGKGWWQLNEKQKQTVIKDLVKSGKAKKVVHNPDDTDRIPHQTAGGRADTRYNRAYESASEYGIFDKEGRKEFAERKSKTQGAEDVQYKKNVRAWVGAAKSALSSGNHYRIAETAREVPYTPPGSEGITEHEGISQHIGQANIAGQHIEQSLGKGDKKGTKEHETEFASIVDTIDAQTKSWPE